MLNAEGKLLYIGKANNLRRRVNSYFTNSSRHSDKVLDLVRHARDVIYEQTGSELEASLREADLIRTLKPPYNQLSKHLPRVAFLKLTVRNAYPRLSIAAKPSSDRAMYVGPFRNRAFAERAQRLLARLFWPQNMSGQPLTDSRGVSLREWSNWSMYSSVRRVGLTRDLPGTSAAFERRPQW